MCGLAGIVDPHGGSISRDVLQGMASQIEHRGPDGSGFWIKNGIGLAHQRLAIIDLSHLSNQPMVTLDNRFALVFNGEIYNFKDLRKELELLGHVFRTSSDTEVLLHCWVEWGSRCVLKLNGMFAFAIHDSSEKTTYLVRDRQGIKPLYLGRFDNIVLFSSEQRAILCHPNARRELDEDALIEYLSFQNIYSSKTLMKNIELLPPGSVTEINPDGKVETTIFWHFDFIEDPNLLDTHDLTDELEVLLRQAVERQMISDVEIGSYLSGGTDSGSIASIASKFVPNLKTFTVGFGMDNVLAHERLFDERKTAADVAKFIGSSHFEVLLNPYDMENAIPIVCQSIEEPRVGQSYPNFYAADLASRYVKVVLAGTGGDELFGGYPWRYRAARQEKKEDFLEQYFAYWQRMIPTEELGTALRPISNRVDFSRPREIFMNKVLEGNLLAKSFEDRINLCLSFEAKTFLHGLLVIEDKLSMHHSLETRVPMLDNDLVDFAIRCPVRFKIGAGNDNGAVGKQILRAVSRRLLPPSSDKNPKQGFSAPDETWFAKDSSRFVLSNILEKDNNLFDVLDQKWVENIVNGHMSGTVNKRLMIWSLLSLSFLLETM